MSKLFEIFDVHYHEATYTIMGRTENVTNHYFKVDITHSSNIINFDNNESCIRVSDNNGGQYEIQVVFMFEDENTFKGKSPIYFNYVNHHIPSFVWCIVTGMILAEL